MPAADEQLLILQAKDGNRDAFGALVRRYMKQVYNVAHSFLNDHQHAEDATQEAFVHAYESLKSFRGDAEFGTWLYRIVVNLSINKLKRKKRTEYREMDLSVAPAVIVESPGMGDDTDISSHLERALHELPTLQRAVVILRHIDGLSTKQVSSILKCSEGTVKTHLYRGLKKMRQKLYYLNGGIT